MTLSKPVPHKEAISASSLKWKLSFQGLDTAFAMRHQVQNELTAQDPAPGPGDEPGENHHLWSSGRRV